MEHLDSVIFLVTYEDVSIWCAGDSPWIRHLSIPISFFPERTNPSALTREDLYPVIVTIGDDDLSVGFVDAHAGQTVEFSVRLSVLAKLTQELSVSVEHLNSVIGGICDYDLAIFVDGDSSRPREAAHVGAATTELDARRRLRQVVRQLSFRRRRRLRLV